MDFSVKPQIPAALLRPMAARVKEGGYFDYARGGQWIEGKTERVEFRGALLPISNEELKLGQPGTYTEDDRKLYTNGYALRAGQQVEAEGQTYTVMVELDHGYIHPMRRYIVRRKGATAD